MNVMVTTNQKPILNTQNIQKMEPKQITKESHQCRQEESKRREEQRTTKTTRKQETGNKYIPTHNYFKCKWTKYSKQKT